MIVFWHQRDLRVEGNEALFEAWQRCDQILPVFCFEALGDAGKWYLLESLKDLENEYKKRGAQLVVLNEAPKIALAKLVKRFKPEAVFYNKTHSPQETFVEKLGVEAVGFNGSYMIDPQELGTKTGTPYQMFTPFAKAAKSKLYSKEFKKKIGKMRTVKVSSAKLPVSNLDFSESWQCGRKNALKRLQAFKRVKNYATVRNLPSVEGTSKLSPALHFGELSPQEVYAAITNSTYRSELLWREFANYLLNHNRNLQRFNFNSKFDDFPWKKSKRLLDLWKDGMTGYPIVDAGMQELIETGWMHNRVRMIVASFLVKDLMIHWREGETFFRDALVDADEGSNAMNWQWCAGSGPDAAPFFRIFNPTLQGKKFDPKGEYIKQYLPELENVPVKWIHTPHLSGLELEYPEPIVDHDEARLIALDAYKKL